MGIQGKVSAVSRWAHFQGSLAAAAHREAVRGAGCFTRNKASFSCFLRCGMELSSEHFSASRHGVALRSAG